MAGDLQGPCAWDKHRLRTGVPAHSDQPTIYGGDHAATSDAADLLRLHQYPVANLDHRRLLWMVSRPGHPKCPHHRRLHSSKTSGGNDRAGHPASRPAACDTTAHAAPMTVGDLPAMLQRLPQNAEQLATERGCEGTAKSNADCCPFAARGRAPAADAAGAGAFGLVMAHETPGDPRVRALPSPYRARALVSPGVSCRRARSHAGPGASTGARPSLWTMLGTSRAGLLTAAWTAVDNRVAAWGRLRG
jgi:hypothetical protein